jgi:hypothetical protein
MFLPFFAEICMEGTLWMSNFKILTIFSCFWTPIYVITKSGIRFVLRGNLFSKNQGFLLSLVEFVWKVPLGCQISKFRVFRAHF